MAVNTTWVDSVPTVKVDNDWFNTAATLDTGIKNNVKNIIGNAKNTNQDIYNSLSKLATTDKNYTPYVAGWLKNTNSGLVDLKGNALDDSYYNDANAYSNLNSLKNDWANRLIGKQYSNIDPSSDSDVQAYRNSLLGDAAKMSDAIGNWQKIQATSPSSKWIDGVSGADESHNNTVRGFVDDGSLNDAQISDKFRGLIYGNGSADNQGDKSYQPYYSSWLKSNNSGLTDLNGNALDDSYYNGIVNKTIDYQTTLGGLKNSWANILVDKKYSGIDFDSLYGNKASAMKQAYKNELLRDPAMMSEGIAKWKASQAADKAATEKATADTAASVPSIANLNAGGMLDLSTNKLNPTKEQSTSQKINYGTTQQNAALNGVSTGYTLDADGNPVLNDNSKVSYDQLDTENITKVGDVTVDTTGATSTAGQIDNSQLSNISNIDTSLMGNQQVANILNDGTRTDYGVTAPALDKTGTSAYNAVNNQAINSKGVTDAQAGVVDKSKIDAVATDTQAAHIDKAEQTTVDNNSLALDNVSSSAVYDPARDVKQYQVRDNQLVGNKINSALQNFNPETINVNKDMLVSDRLAGMLSRNNPYIQQARDAATLQAGRRGMLNSGAAAGFAQDAAIRAAMPIAQQDASTYYNAAAANMAAKNAALAKKMDYSVAGISDDAKVYQAAEAANQLGFNNFGQSALQGRVQASLQDASTYANTATANTAARNQTNKDNATFQQEANTATSNAKNTISVSNSKNWLEASTTDANNITSTNNNNARNALQLETTRYNAITNAILNDAKITADMSVAEMTQKVNAAIATANNYLGFDSTKLKVLSDAITENAKNLLSAYTTNANNTTSANNQTASNQTALAQTQAQINADKEKTDAITSNDWQVKNNTIGNAEIQENVSMLNAMLKDGTLAKNQIWSNVVQNTYDSLKVNANSQNTLNNLITTGNIDLANEMAKAILTKSENDRAEKRQEILDTLANSFKESQIRITGNIELDKAIISAKATFIQAKYGYDSDFIKEIVSSRMTASTEISKTADMTAGAQASAANNLGIIQASGVSSYQAQMPSLAQLLNLLDSPSGETVNKLLK